MKKTSDCEIFCLNMFFKFAITHFKIRCIFFVFILKNTFDNLKIDFLNEV